MYIYYLKVQVFISDNMLFCHVSIYYFFSTEDALPFFLDYLINSYLNNPDWWRKTEKGSPIFFKKERKH